MNPLIIYLITVNISAFFLAGYDKARAVNHKYRVPENTLLLWAVLGGGAGLMLGFFLFRHKTRKMRFMVGVPLIIAAQIVIICALIHNSM